ncbi:RIP metalloprotease RseP [Massilia sp. S19_KUP03_FR1]|uniref:RIP metalloprotease RseP n=1 Tax=Massilia sp. S19_KUP03_FR1 TaxID=3025503 RepID=UPI002FCDA0C9
MNILIAIVAGLLALGPLVILHELGHYAVARLCGVKVLRFSIGMGKVVWSRKIGPDQTEWAVSALPLGGYVKMLDARDPDVVPGEHELHREFTRKNVWQRIAIVAAGPLANFIVAIVLMAGVYVYGVDEPTARLRAAPEASSVYQAGLRGGDRISAVNGEPVASWLDLQWEIVRAVADKGELRFDVVGQAGGTYTASIPASVVAALKVDSDVMSALGLQLWRPRARIDQVVPGGAAEKAGLRAGDVVTAIDGAALVDGIAFIDAIRAAPGRTVQVAVQRDGQALLLGVTPASVDVKNGKGEGRIGALIPQAPEMVRVSSNPFAAIGKGAAYTWDRATMSVRMIGKMFTGEVSVKNLSGPITIADVAGQSAKGGLIVYLQFIAFISISLGVMNLLPIPVLDGGHLLYYSLEVLTGRPLPERIRDMAQRAGVGLLFMLMALAVFNDISRHL